MPARIHQSALAAAPLACRRCWRSAPAPFDGEARSRKAFARIPAAFCARKSIDAGVSGARSAPARWPRPRTHRRRLRVADQRFTGECLGMVASQCRRVPNRRLRTRPCQHQPRGAAGHLARGEGQRRLRRCSSLSTAMTTPNGPQAAERIRARERAEAAATRRRRAVSPTLRGDSPTSSRSRSDVSTPTEEPASIDEDRGAGYIAGGAAPSDRLRRRRPRRRSRRWSAAIAPRSRRLNRLGSSAPIPRS